MKNKLIEILYFLVFSKFHVLNLSYLCVPRELGKYIMIDIDDIEIK